MRNLVNGIKTFKKPKGDGNGDLGGSMVFLQESEEFTREGNISPVKFDEDTDGVYDTDEEMYNMELVIDTMELMNGLMDKHCNKMMGHLDLREKLDEDMKKMTQVVKRAELDEDMKKMKADEKTTQVVILEELDEDMKHVGPFAIRTSKVPHDRWCKYLEHCYENVEDIKDIAGVEDSDSFNVNKKMFFEELMPGKWLSNVLVNLVTEILNIRQIRESDSSNTPIQRWYFPTFPRDHRIYSPKSRMKYQIRMEQLRGTKQVVVNIN